MKYKDQHKRRQTMNQTHNPKVGGSKSTPSNQNSFLINHFQTPSKTLKEALLPNCGSNWFLFGRIPDDVRSPQTLTLLSNSSPDDTLSVLILLAYRFKVSLGAARSASAQLLDQLRIEPSNRCIQNSTAYARQLLLDSSCSAESDPPGSITDGTAGLSGFGAISGSVDHCRFTDYPPTVPRAGSVEDQRAHLFHRSLRKREGALAHLPGKGDSRSAGAV